MPPTREGYGRAVPWPGKQTKPCVPVVEIMVPCPRVGSFMFWATMVVIVSGGRHGATHDLAQRGVCWSGWESAMAIDRFLQNAIGPSEWEHKAMGSVVWV